MKVAIPFGCHARGSRNLGGSSASFKLLMYVIQFSYSMIPPPLPEFLGPPLHAYSLLFKHNAANITTTLSENTLTTLPTLTTNETTGNDSAIMCSEGFFYDQDNTRLCRPECGEFNKLPQFEIILQQVCTFIGFITAVIVLILAFTIQRDKL